MQDCFRKYPELYEPEDEGEAEGPRVDPVESDHAVEEAPVSTISGEPRLAAAFLNEAQGERPSADEVESHDGSKEGPALTASAPSVSAATPLDDVPRQSATHIQPHHDPTLARAVDEKGEQVSTSALSPRPLKSGDGSQGLVPKAAHDAN